MESDSKSLRQRLREAGLSDPLIDAAWPTWWSDDASESQSAQAELRFTIARKLGLSPTSLFHDEVEFVWKDEARFKHLSSETDTDKSILTSFGLSVCRLLDQLLPERPKIGRIAALELRNSILQARPFIDLQVLLATCWGVGIPVIHLRVFPLKAKRMSAMAVHVGDRHAILLGRDAKYPAWAAFTLAHELGHIMLGHLESSSAIVDVGELLNQSHGDSEERGADEFALELLLGTATPKIDTSIMQFNARQLAQAVLDAGQTHQVEPGTLALCLGFATGEWPVVTAAMPYIYMQPKPVWREVNKIAEGQMRLDLREGDSTDYLGKLLGIENGE